MVTLVSGEETEVRAVLIFGLALAMSAGATVAQPAKAKVAAGLPISCPAQLTLSAQVPMIFAAPQQAYIFDRVELTGDKAQCIYVNNNTGAPLTLDARAASCRAMAPQAWQPAPSRPATQICFKGQVCTLSCG